MEIWGRGSSVVKHVQLRAEMSGGHRTQRRGSWMRRGDCLGDILVHLSPFRPLGIQLKSAAESSGLPASPNQIADCVGWEQGLRISSQLLLLFRDRTWEITDLSNREDFEKCKK